MVKSAVVLIWPASGNDWLSLAVTGGKTAILLQLQRMVELRRVTEQRQLTYNCAKSKPNEEIDCRQSAFQRRFVANQAMHACVFCSHPTINLYPGP